MSPAQRATALDEQEVPRFLRGALYVMLVVAGLASVPMIGAYGPLPTTVLLDAWIIALLVTMFVRGRTEMWSLMILLVAYACTRVFGALSTLSPLEDFLQAYRWVIYLVVFALAVGRKWGPVAPLVKVTWALLLMALVKAAATYLLEGSGERPGLLLENNFELALFAGLIVVLYPHLRHRFAIIAAMGALTFLSGSRSGAIAFLLLVLFSFTQIRSKNLLIRYMLVCAIPIAALFPIVIFAERASRDSRIDRLNFFNVFMADASRFSPIEWLFGTIPITPMSPGACDMLSYYERLFSSVGDGSCYSVILHAFAMRVVFDAGIFGLVLAFGVAWWTMRRGGVRTVLAATLFLIAAANSLSVSGLNNPYVALPILLAILTASVPAASVASELPNYGSSKDRSGSRVRISQRAE